MIDTIAEIGPIAAVPFFMALYFAFAAWAYHPKNKARMKSYGDIPLKEHSDGDR